MSPGAAGEGDCLLGRASRAPTGFFGDCASAGFQIARRLFTNCIQSRSSDNFVVNFDLFKFLYHNVQKDSVHGSSHS